MAVFEVTYRAVGPPVNGSRVEVLVTLPVNLHRQEQALERAEADWEPLVSYLQVLAGGAQLEVSTEVRRI